MVKKSGKKPGMKVCPQCSKTCGARSKVCPQCKYEFGQKVRRSKRSKIDLESAIVKIGELGGLDSVKKRLDSVRKTEEELSALGGSKSAQSAVELIEKLRSL